jgi:signal transduction histidine kinase
MDGAVPESATGSGPGVRSRRLLAPALLTDWVPALALTMFAQLDLRFRIDGSDPYGPPAAAAFVTAVATAVLVLRRRFPLATVCTVAAAVAMPELVSRLTVTLWGHLVPVVVATYSVARFADRRRAAVGLGAAVLAITVVMLRVPSVGTVGNIPFTAIPIGGAFVLGRVLRARWESQQAMAQQARELQADRDERVRRAVSEERARIARELHDLVAQSVSLMVVQAGAAEDLLDRRPDAAREPLRTVQDTGRQAIDELGHVLGLLRGGEAPPDRAPQPDVEHIPALLDRLRRAGLPVRLVGSLPQPLPPGIGLAVYRIVQESLTNTLKHAPGAAATVTLTSDERSIGVEVTDDGAGAVSAPPPGTGNGLIGMRERVAVYGGSFHCGPTDDAGFSVHAVLPLTTGAPR